MHYGMLVSVVVPIYNRAHLVPRVVGSICAQTYRNLEIILADDCSTDDLESAVAALEDPRVRIVRREQNGGVAAARNTGVDAAQGELIAFHDSDDYCTADRIELSVRALLDLPEDYAGVYGARLFYNEVSEEDYGRMKVHILPRAGNARVSGDLAERTVRSNILNFPTLLVKAESLRAAGPSDVLLRKNVDWDLALRLTRQGKFGFIPEPLILTPTSLDPEVSAARVSRSTRQGARSFARISGKLRHQGADPDILATHYGTTGRYLMRLDRPGFARRFFRASLDCNRLQPKLWVHYLLSYAPGLHRRLRSEGQL